MMQRVRDVSLVLKKISNRNVYYKVKCIFGQVYIYIYIYIYIYTYIYIYIYIY